MRSRCASRRGWASSRQFGVRAAVLLGSLLAPLAVSIPEALAQQHLRLPRESVEIDWSVLDDIDAPPPARIQLRRPPVRTAPATDAAAPVRTVDRKPAADGKTVRKKSIKSAAKTPAKAVTADKTKNADAAGKPAAADKIENAEAAGKPAAPAKTAAPVAEPKSPPPAAAATPDSSFTPPTPPPAFTDKPPPSRTAPVAAASDAPRLVPPPPPVISAPLAPPAETPKAAAETPKPATPAAEMPKATPEAPKAAAQPAPVPLAPLTPAVAVEPPPAAPAATAAPPKPVAVAPEIPPPPPPVLQAPMNTDAVTAAAPGQQLAALPPAAAPAGDGRLATVAFVSGAAELPETARSALNRVASDMKRDESVQVQLLAYASSEDEAGMMARRLSLSRALAVRSYLIEQGVRSARMHVRALGNKVSDGPSDRVDVLLVRR